MLRSCLFAISESMFNSRLKTTWYGLSRISCQAFCRLFFSIDVFGLENIPSSGGVLLACNHQSYIDPVFCGLYIRRELCFMARDTLFRNAFFSSLIRSYNAIPVKRGQSDLRAMRTVVERLREGYGVCLFPEATRTSNGRISDFKPGFGLLAKRGKASVVPILIEGAFDCWPRDKKIFRPGEIVVCFGKAVPAEFIQRVSNNELARLITVKVRKMQNEIRLRRGKEPFDYPE